MPNMFHTLPISNGGRGSGNYGHKGRAGKVGGSQPDSSSSLMDKLAEEGGFTYQPMLGMSPTDGYMVSPYKDRELVIELSKMSKKDLSSHIASNSDLLSRGDHFLGGWVDEGKVYLDISIRFDDQESARLAAIENNQLAFFDLFNKKTIYTDTTLNNRSRTMDTKKPTVTISRPVDKSLEAYKNWIDAVCKAMGIGGSMTEEEYKADWIKFWSK